MSPTILDGTRTTANVASVRRWIDVDATIERIDVSDIPLVVLLSELRRKPALDSQVRWLEDEYVPALTTVNGAQLVGDTTIEVAAGTATYARPSDLVYLPTTGEVMLIVDVPDANTWEVTRAWGSTAVAISNGDEALILGSAMTEASGAPEVRSTVEVEKFNYVQTFKWAYELSSEWGEDVEQLSEHDLQQQRDKAVEEYFLRCERSAWFGTRNQDTSNAKRPRRSMGGVNYWVTTNVLDVSSGGGTLLEEDFIKLMIEPVFRRGSGEKWLFAAPRIHTAISGFARGKIQVMDEANTFGVNVMTYLTPHGKVHLVLQRLFSEFTAGSKMGFMLDMNKVWLRVLRQVYIKRNIQQNDEDIIKEMLLGKKSLELKNEKAHGKLAGVTE